MFFLVRGHWLAEQYVNYDHEDRASWLIKCTWTWCAVWAAHNWWLPPTAATTD